jgi:putative alpha-1,2-mannosidase
MARLYYAYTTGLLDISNEPSFPMPYLYHYAGRPGLSAKMVHNLNPSSFNVSKIGLPGNDDGGTLSALTALPKLGRFPNAEYNVYFIVPPFFEEVAIANGLTAKTTSIRIVNGTFDSPYLTIHIQNAKLNGKLYTKKWIGHECFLDGMTLELEVGRNESDGGAGPEDLPPSLGSATECMRA